MACHTHDCCSLWDYPPFADFEFLYNDFDSRLAIRVFRGKQFGAEDDTETSAAYLILNLQSVFGDRVMFELPKLFILRIPNSCRSTRLIAFFPSYVLTTTCNLRITLSWVVIVFCLDISDDRSHDERGGRGWVPQAVKILDRRSEAVGNIHVANKILLAQPYFLPHAQCSNSVSIFWGNLGEAKRRIILPLSPDVRSGDRVGPIFSTQIRLAQAC